MAPPRRPLPVLWSPAEVADIVQRYVIHGYGQAEPKENDEEALSPFKLSGNRAMRKLTAIALARNPDADPAGDIPMLASIAVTNYLAEWCERETERRVKEIREDNPELPWTPVPWPSIAAATGYASANTVANRFDPERRQRRADAARERRSQGGT